MALITTYDHFNDDPISLPNAVPATNNTEATKLQLFIAKYEEEYLKFIFGQEFYDLFIAGLNAETAIYKAIKNGDTFRDTSNVLQKWEGFTKGKNPIANYIYWYYQRSNASTTFGIGVRKGKAENSDEASPAQKMVDAWNEMVKFNFKLHQYLESKQSTFTTYIGFVYSPYFYNPMNIQDNQNLFIAQNIFGL